MKYATKLFGLGLGALLLILISPRQHYFRWLEWKTEVPFQSALTANRFCTPYPKRHAILANQVIIQLFDLILWLGIFIWKTKEVA